MEKPDPKLNILEQIRIESPCTLPWDRLQADGAHHHCDLCQKTVFDLTEMSTAELERLFDDPDQSPCIRFARKPDGQIFSIAGPDGFRVKIFQRLRRRASWAASLFAMLFLPGCQAIHRTVNSMYAYGMPARYVRPAEVETLKPKVPQTPNEVADQASTQPEASR